MLWAEFINNDGANQAQPQRTLRKGVERKYQSFAQAHYTMAVSAYLLCALTDKIEDSVAKRAAENGAIDSCDAYLAEVEHYLLFTAYLGNICDQIKLMAEQADPYLSQKMNAELGRYYNVRHASLHGPRVPTRNDLLELYVPRPGAWERTMAWKDVPEGSFEPLSEHCKTIRKELFLTLNSLHGALRGAIGEFFEPAPPRGLDLSTVKAADSTVYARVPGKSLSTEFRPASGSATRIRLLPSGDGQKSV